MEVHKKVTKLAVDELLMRGKELNLSVAFI